MSSAEHPADRTPFTRPGEGRVFHWGTWGLVFAMGAMMPHSGAHAAEGVLGSFEETLKKQRPPSTEEKPPRRYGGECAEEDEDSLGDLFAEMFIEPFVKQVLCAPFTWPRHALNNDFEIDSGFSADPFDRGKSARRSWRASLRTARQWGAGAFVGDRIDGDFFFSRRFGIEGAHARYVEHSDRGDDHLTMTEVVGTFVFARGPVAEFRAGVGYQRLDGRSRHEGGKAVYRVRLFRKPFSVDLDFGATLGMGDHALWEARPALSCHWNRAAVSLGYRRWSAGGAKIQGPELGLSVFF